MLGQLNINIQKNEVEPTYLPPSTKELKTDNELKRGSQNFSLL